MADLMTSPFPFHVMTKPTGPICNLDCTYCFYLEKEDLYPGKKNWAMSPEVLESYIRQNIAAQPGDAMQFAWQGGEPTLLGVDFFKNVVRLEKLYANGKDVQNVLQTNGILIDDTWADFLASENFLIGISIDGPRELHDHYRVDKGGQPTFDKVMKAVRLFKKHAVEYNTLTVVNRLNSSYPLEVYRFLKEIGSGHMQFIPVVERRAQSSTHKGLQLVLPAFLDNAEVTPWSVQPGEFGRFLCAIFDEWVRMDVGKRFIQTFEVALEIWYGVPSSLCVFGKTCGNALALEHSGDLYSCDHFVYPEHRLGNIMDVPLAALLQSAQQRKFGADKNDTLPRYCRQCDVRFACNGECPKHRFARTPDGEPHLNYLCAGYKQFFHHIDPYMKFMVNELKAGRAPVNVMWYAAQQDALRMKNDVGRNSVCTCGSGLRYKRCCGRQRN
jgi:serine-type anaerobic sulfatase-maturating enzyme